jgi:two-component system, NarL family, nitrate/nitrite response regulator NarL
MLGLLLGAAVIADSAVVRRGLTEILNATRDLHVIASVPLTAGPTLEPEGVDLVVEDVPDRASAELLLARLPAQAPALVLVADPEHARALVRGGVRGAIARESSSEQVAAASVAVAAGLHVFDRATLSAWSAPNLPAGDAPTLTPRERRVLELVASGLSNRAIADELGVSEHTVKFHVRSLLDKLGAETRADAVARAARSGVLTL